ncbi:hypothetical protein EJB05_49821, partial [Eragrostis curvula]
MMNRFFVIDETPLTVGNHNLQFVYSGFANASLALDGTASVTPTGLLELTNGTVMSMGHAFYPAPLRLRDSPNSSTVQSFSSSFVFGIISVYDLSSHGLTMLLAPNKNISATPVQYLGLFNGSNNGNTTNHIFAVELDTWQNSEFRDINNNHIGIDINGLTSVKSYPAGFFHDQSGSFNNLTLTSQEAMQVWVEYDREKTQIDVTMAPLAMAKPRRPTVSAICNLSDVLTDEVYIGFSSSTGKIHTQHYVLGWSFAMNNTTAPSIDVTMLPKLPRHHEKGRRSWVYAEVRDDWELEFGPHRFSYKDLFHATGGFENKNLLGVGGFGRVYKGVLSRSRLKIAVKRVSHDSKQGMKEFIAEIVSIGRLQNRNLVQLLGYCRRKGELLLVYEYMPNGSLDKYLHNGKEDNSVLSWTQRFRIIKGIASGLLYLHEEWEKVVVHRDIKASNVLLGDEMNGRLGDFGLARLYDHGADPLTTHVVGTIGYLAPELASSGNATPPTDVFAFGIFVLEVTCGQRPVNHQNTQDSQVMLVDWVLDKVQKGSFGDTVDVRLKGRFDVGEAYLALKIGLLCSHPFANARPTMRQVMQYFDGEIEPPDLSIEMLAFMQSEGLLQATRMLAMAMKHTSFFQYLLLVLTTLASCDDQFLFSGFTQSSLNLDGCAIVTNGGLLDLSNGTAILKGHAFYPIPLHFRKSPGGKVQSFSVNAVFSIFITYPDLSADGMAFFIAPTKNFSDAQAAKYFGLLNEKNNGDPNKHIFMIELDTYKNAELQDINDNHVGININSAISLQSGTAGFYEDDGGAFRNLMLNGNKGTQLWVDYDEGATQINVTLAPIDLGKPSRPLLSVTYDLSNVLSNSASYIGFSSIATPINTRQYVMGWSFGMNKPAPPLDVSKLPKLPFLGSKPQSRILTIVLPIATATLILSVGTLVVLIVRKRMKYAEVREDWEGEFGPHRFSYKDLFHATGGFRNKHLLGQGGFGKVYKGVLPLSNVEVAVKRMSHESRQGMKEFVTEIVSIGRLRHRNLVQLLGYCRRKGELFLVYNYMPNGSLDKYLHCEENKDILNWAQRFQVIKGIATGLLYLHEKWEKIVIHRDIKASNVLLDGDMNGRLGDFGLARLYDHGTDPQTTHMVGTKGYLAPELLRTGKASPLTDVFAFGMFLLEVATGKLPVMKNAEGNEFFLADWVLEHWKNGLLTKTLDSRLQGDYNIDEAYVVLKLGLLCLHPLPSSRPRMREVMQYLDGDIPLPELKPSELSLDMVALMKNTGLNPSTVSYPQISSSFGTISGLSGGR